jgi:drug/metabolite transporter (DMT)-like permease
MTKYRLKSYLYLLTVAAVWGAAGPVIKYTLSGIKPLQFLAYRFFISAIIALVYFTIRGINFKKVRKNLKWIVLYGLLAYTLALGSLFTGLDRASVLDLALIGTLGPLLITSGGAVFFKDHITKREKIGITIILAGALLNSFVPILLNGAGIKFTGNMFIFAFLLFDTAAILLAKYIVKSKIKSITLINLGFIVAAATIIPYSFIIYGSLNVINNVINMQLQYHLGVWYMALLSGTLAYFLYVRGQKSIEVSEAALFNYLQPIFSIPLAVLWLRESLTPTFIVGVIIIATGVIIAEYKKKAIKKPHTG